MTRAVLLIHGWLLGPDDWDTLAPILEREGYDAVERVCMPGHARADEPEKLDYEEFTNKASIREIENSYTKLQKKYDSVDIIGHSMGGAYALYLASKYPVNKIALLAPAIRAIRWTYPFVLLRYKFRTRKLRKIDKKNPASISELSPQLWYYRDADYRKILSKRVLKYYTLRNFLVLLKNIRKARRNLDKVTCPVFIAYGDMDEVVPYSVCKILKKKLVNCQSLTFERYEGYGHNFMYSHFDKVIIDKLLEYFSVPDHSIKEK